MDDERILELMREAINESKLSEPEDYGPHPMVGAILADSSGEIVARAHRGEGGSTSHAEFLLIAKTEELGVSMENLDLFVTLEPCVSRGPDKTPCAQRIIAKGISRVHIGMLDPNPAIRGRGEIFLRDQKVRVERFPGELVEEIMTLNNDFLEQFRKDILPNNSLYVSKQIPDLITSHLQRDAGMSITDIPDDWDLTVDDIVQHLESVARANDRLTLAHQVREARGHAYDEKYADYTYEDDARGLGDSWKSEFNSILAVLDIPDVATLRALDIGIGNGLEVAELFPGCRELTGVDIGARSIELAKSRLPRAAFIRTDAGDLSAIESGSQDLYVSLRTYQSSYFDIPRSIREAYRVVRRGGAVVISIANGFVGKDGVLLPGLVFPRSQHLDQNRPFQLAERIRAGLSLFRFEDVGVRTSLSEIYIFGLKP